MATLKWRLKKHTTFFQLCQLIFSPKFSKNFQKICALCTRSGTATTKRRRRRYMAYRSWTWTWTYGAGAEAERRHYKYIEAAAGPGRNCAGGTILYIGAGPALEAGQKNLSSHFYYIILFLKSQIKIAQKN